MARRKATQAEKAEYVAGSREQAVGVAPAVAESLGVEAPQRTPFKQRDIRADLAAPIPDAKFEERYPGWVRVGDANSASLGPLPPPAMGTRSDGSPWVPPEPRRQPVVMSQAMLSARMNGGEVRRVYRKNMYDPSDPGRLVKEYYASLYDEPVRRDGRYEGVYSGLIERVVYRFEEPLYTPFSHTRMPWGFADDYEDARKEAVRQWDAALVPQRSHFQGATTESLGSPKYPCHGCHRLMPKLNWHEGHVKWLCEDCAPELALAAPVGD